MCCERTRLPASNFRRTAGTIDASNGRAVRSRVSRHIEIYCITLTWRKLRVRQKSKPCDRVEGRFRFVPLDACVFDPEIGVTSLAPICHFAGVEKLNGKVEPAHLAIFLEVPQQFFLQALRLAFL